MSQFDLQKGAEMTGESLPPDPESLEMWQQLPQNQPSREALPPAAGGARLAMRMGLAFLLILSAVIIIGRILQRGPA